MRSAFIIVALAATAFVIAADAPAGKAAVGSEKAPVTVAKSAAPITVDGDASDWAKIPALPAPYSRKAAGMMKLAWRDDGLYGLVTVPDAKIDIDESNPWMADAVEFWLDPKFARATDISDGATQIAFAPNPAAGAGKAVVVVAQGSIDASAIKAMWKPTTAAPAGYTIEFFIPATSLADVKFAPGTKMGTNYAVDDDGAPIEQFFADKDTDQGYANPSLWGIVELGK